jgi:hypothetical protein
VVESGARFRQPVAIQLFQADAKEEISTKLIKMLMYWVNKKH